MSIKTAGFQILLRSHSAQVDSTLPHPERLREIIGEALDKLGIEEEIDYTLQVLRYYSE